MKRLRETLALAGPLAMVVAAWSSLFAGCSSHDSPGSSFSSDASSNDDDASASGDAFDDVPRIAPDGRGFTLDDEPRSQNGERGGSQPAQASS